MTDARYPERWLHDRRITRLSDRAHRAYVVTLVYAVANRTDGRFAVEDLEDLPAYVQAEATALVEAGLWEPNGDGTGFVAVDFLDTQSSCAELEGLDKSRLVAREKKARQRAKGKSEDPTSEPEPAVPGDVPGDHTGQDRLGQDRQGQLKGGSGTTHLHALTYQPKTCGYCHQTFVPTRPTQATHSGMCPPAQATA